MGRLRNHRHELRKCVREEVVRVFDTLKTAQVTVIDLRAGLLSPTLKMLAETDFLNGVKEGRLKITVLHVLGSTQASFDEIKATAAHVEGSKHFLVMNHINDTAYSARCYEPDCIGGGSLHDKLDVLRLDLTPALDLGLVPVLRVTLKVFPRQLSGEGQVAGELLADVRITGHS
jgi:hypothetical protein